MLSTALVVAGLTTGHKIGLVVVGGSFILFALICSFVLPKRNPDFPGKHVGWFVAVCVLFFLAMISAVLIFGAEKKEASAESSSTPAATTQSSSTPGQTTSTPATTTVASGAQGDPAAGKLVFASAGCGGCHTLKAAGATGTVGPNLDQLKPETAIVVHQVEVGGGPMPAFKGSLSEKQIQDVAAFVSASTHS